MESNRMTFFMHSLLTGILFFITIQQQSPLQEPSSNNTIDYANSTLPACVKLEAIKSDSDSYSITRFGSGVIVSSDGIVITNHHIIGDATRIVVSLYDGRIYEACVLQFNAAQDLAVLQIEEDDLQFLRLGKSSQLELGDEVFAIGNPRHLDFTLTKGIIGAFNRKINLIKHPEAEELFIQTDVPINSGSSGGPLINNKGELVGINTAISSMTGQYEGYSFAQPVEMVEKIISSFVEEN